MHSQAIETSYQGYRFRSRLEARWAVFFDALDFIWKYEIQGFDLEELGWYLPDFLTVPPGIGPSWVEIKPFLFMKEKSETVFAPDVKKTLDRFTKLMYVQVPDSPYKSYCGIVLGGVPGDKIVSGMISVPLFMPETYEMMTGKSMTAAMCFAECPSCGQICCLALGDKKQGHDVICTCLFRGAQKINMTLKDTSLDRYARSDRLMAAYDAARGARFEHGETPKVKRGRQAK